MRVDQLQSLANQQEDDFDRALAMANRLPSLWAAADEDGRREVLEAVFVKFVV